MYGFEVAGHQTNQSANKIVISSACLIFAACQLSTYLMYITETYAKRRENQSLSHLAYADGLTNLANRSKADKLMEELNSATDDYCIMSIDLNGLKDVNDKFGHPTGDRYLKEFAKVLSNTFGENDFSARIGGDEFLVVLRDANTKDISALIGRMNSALNVMNALYPDWSRILLAKENNGFWETMSHNETRVTTLDGPALCMANHEANGITELRTGKIVKDKSDIHGIWNYGKLVFNTKFPWESTPQGKIFGVNWDAGNSDNNANGHADRSADISVDGNTAFLEEDQYSTIRPESQQYVLQYLDENIDAVASFTPNATFWHGEKEGVLYRRQFWEYGTDTETHWRTAIDLADFAMPYGIMRADKIRLFRRPIRLTLGSFGFPDNGTDIQIREKDGCKAIILKGKDYTGKNKQLAFTIMDGWSDIKLRVEFYSLQHKSDLCI